MGKGDFMTPKAIANRIKAKGLQKLRWYCQMCEMMLFAENTQKYISSFSQQFHDAFMKLLSTRYGTRKVHANLVYQEYISDKQHLHMNATQWISLTAYCKYLGKEGLCEVEETEKGWMIRWIDRSPEALARQEAVLKKMRAEKSDEEREKRMLEEQISKAQAASGASATDAVDEATAEESDGLKRDSQEQPIKLQLGASLTKAAPKKFEVKKINVLASASKKTNAPTAPAASAAAGSTTRGPSPEQSKSSAQAAPAAPAAAKPMSALERVLQSGMSAGRKRAGDAPAGQADKRARW
nr:hypothetical protein HK105_001779 [Polyrhizophydium stewartii]